MYREFVDKMRKHRIEVKGISFLKRGKIRVTLEKYRAIWRAEITRQDRSHFYDVEVFSPSGEMRSTSEYMYLIESSISKGIEYLGRGYRTKVIDDYARAMAEIAVFEETGEDPYKIYESPGIPRKEYNETYMDEYQRSIKEINQLL